MTMIQLMAWRNIWRNPTRSFVVIIAIAIGIWAALFMSGFATGMIKGYIDNAVSNIVSHLQIHHPQYDRDFEARYFIPDGAKIIAGLQADPQVLAVSGRALANGMISSAKTARGIRIKGVDPGMEARVSALDTKIRKGEYFGDRRNEILIGAKLAEKLGVDLRSKVVLTFQDLDGEIIAGAFRIVGIFGSGNAPFDEANVFVRFNDLNRLLGAQKEADTAAPAAGAQPASDNPPPANLIHEIAIMLKSPEMTDAERDRLLKALPELKTQTYREISPDLELYESQMKTVSIIYLTVIMLALVFGIVNTMLMAVLERIRELGMLMAIGMNKARVFFMIVIETILLGVVGAPLGLFLGFATIAYFGKYGIDLSAFSEPLEMYGMSDMIYFAVEPAVYYQVPVAVALTAVTASIYPAYKAIRLRPVEAIRTL